MNQSTTVTLLPEVQEALEAFSRQEGISADEIVNRAIKQHLFLQQFRTLRERLAAKANQQGIVTDEDVFDRVSA